MSLGIRQIPITITKNLNDANVKVTDLKNKIVDTAKKVNYWAVFGLIFLSLGTVATTIASCGLHLMAFNAYVVTLDIILGYGAISLFIGAMSITKALINRSNILNNPKRFGITGIKNKGTNTCWLNSLMQMLLNIPDLKRSLKLDAHFKEFIDYYERALKENIKVDTIKLRDFLTTICPDITEENNFHDSHEALVSILNLIKDSNTNLQNTLIEKKHFLHQNNKQSTSAERTQNYGLIQLPPAQNNNQKDTLYGRINEYFVSKQNSEIDNVVRVTKTRKEKYFYDLLEKTITFSEEVVDGIKKLFLEEKKFQFAPKNLFFNIQRYQFDPNTNEVDSLNNSVKVPLEFKLNKKYVSTYQTVDYELSSFIRHVNAHYISYVKKGDVWFKCDDNTVKKIPLETAEKKAKKAYLVHYKKLSVETLRDPKEFGLTGIENKRTNTCWLNSLMQMLLNIPDLKNSLKLNAHFKEFIDYYESALKENTEVDTIKLRDFLTTICPDITNANNFHDSHEVLVSILDLMKDSNPNLQNTLIEKKHFIHQNNTQSTSEERTQNHGLIQLPPAQQNNQKETLYSRINEYFRSEQNSEMNNVVTVTKTKKEKHFYNLLEKTITFSEDVVDGIKKLFLEEKKFQFAPKDLFFNIQRYQFDPNRNEVQRLDNSVKVPLELKLDKKYLSTNQSVDYELSSFIRHINNHYISYVKKGNVWFKCDDNTVKEISLEKAEKKAKKAYVVHYSKLS